SLCSFTTHVILSFFFFNDTATTDIYTLSLHDALPIFHRSARDAPTVASSGIQAVLEVQVQSSFYQTKDLCREYLLDQGNGQRQPDRKSTRLNSSHRTISYAVFCLKKKRNKKKTSNI